MLLLLLDRTILTTARGRVFFTNWNHHEAMVSNLLVEGSGAPDTPVP